MGIVGFLGHCNCVIYLVVDIRRQVKTTVGRLVAQQHKEHNVKITIELPDDLHKALKSDFAAQVISEKFLGLELSASSKVAHLVLQAAQQSGQPTDGSLCKDCGHSAEIKQVSGCLYHPVSG